MPLAIKSMSLNKIFSETEYDSRIVDYTNEKVLNVRGSVRRSINDNVFLNIYVGRRNEYLKNETIGAQVNSSGDFEQIVELKDGVGIYYVTVEVLLDDGSYDTISQQIILEDRKPIINEFTILNFDRLVNNAREEDYYIFYSEQKNTINISFTSLNNDPDNNYFYKLWLSYEDEPEKAVPINKSQNFINLDMSILTSGTYYIYLKIIDAAGNVSFSRKKIEIFKVFPEIEIEYLKIVPNDYYISLSDNTPGSVRLLLDIKAGNSIDSGELRLYKDNKLINYKSETQKNRIEEIINQNIVKSGFFYLPSIDLKDVWNLSEGDYQLEIFFIDKLDRSFVSNRADIHVKTRNPILDSTQLDINNPGTLILDENNTISFELKENFFKLDTKQIEVFMQTNNPSDPAQREFMKVSSNNENWSFNQSTNSYYTTLRLFLNNDNINKIGDNYSYNYYEFRITNDFGDEGIFRIPLIYKPEKNKVILIDSYLYPEDNLYPVGPDGMNSYVTDLSDDKSSATFLIPYNLLEFPVGLKVINDVDFGDILDFKTSSYQVIYEIDSKPIVNNFTNNEIFLNIPVATTDEFFDEIIYPVTPVVTFYTSENKTEQEKSFFSSFNLDYLDREEIVLPTKTFHGIADKSRFLELLNKDIEIINPNISVDLFNENYSWINFLNTYSYTGNEYRTLIVNDTVVKHRREFFSEFQYFLNIYLYRDLSPFLRDIIIEDTIYDSKFDLHIPFNISGEIIDDLLFFVDTQLEYNSESIQERLNELLEDGKFEKADDYINGEFIINNVKVYDRVSTGDFYCTVYFKYKNVDTIQSFNVYYKSNNMPVEVDFYFEDNTIYSNKGSSIVIDNKNYDSISNISETRIYANNSLIKTVPYFNTDLHKVDINKYDSSGNQIPSNIYLTNPGYYSIRLESDFYITELDEIYTFKSSNKTLSVLNSVQFCNILPEKTAVANYSEFSNLKFLLLPYTKRKRNSYRVELTLNKVKEFDVNLDIIDVSSTSFINYINTDKPNFRLLDFSIPTFNTGLYRLDFKVFDINSNNYNLFTYDVEINDKQPLIEVIDTYDDFTYCSSKFADIELNMKGDFFNFVSSPITFFVENLNGNINSTHEIKGYTNHVYRVPINIGENKIKVKALNAFTGVYSIIELDTIFLFDNSFLDDTYRITDINIINGFKTSSIHGSGVLYSFDRSNDILEFSLNDINENIKTYIIIDEENKIDIDTLVTANPNIYNRTISDIVDKFSFLHVDSFGNEKTCNEFLIKDITQDIEFETAINIINPVSVKDDQNIILEVDLKLLINGPIEVANFKAPLVLNSYSYILNNYFFENIALSGVANFNELSIDQKKFFVSLGVISIGRYHETSVIKDKKTKELLISVATFIYYQLFVSRNYVIADYSNSEKIQFVDKINLLQNNLVTKILRGDPLGI